MAKKVGKTGKSTRSVVGSKAKIRPVRQRPATAVSAHSPAGKRVSSKTGAAQRVSFTDEIIKAIRELRARGGVDDVFGKTNRNGTT